MAIYHCSIRKFSRKAGKSAVAAAAYRAGENLYDELQGRTYCGKQYGKTLIEKFIVLPKNSDPEFYYREILWNEVESAEIRGNACVAREIEIALPYELNDEQRSGLVTDMSLWLVERFQTPVDATVHCPIEEQSAEGIKNVYAQLMFPTRRFEKNEFKEKLRILDDIVRGRQEISLIRQTWASFANAALKKAGVEARINHKSLKDQGIERKPQRRRTKSP